MREVEERVQGAIRQSGYDGMVVFGADNFTYLTGMVLPFPFSYPVRSAIVVIHKDGRKHVVCPFDWKQALLDQGWAGGIEAYSDNSGQPPRAVLAQLAQAMRAMGLDVGRLGLDHARVPQGTLALLSEALPRVQWLPGDEVLRKLRLRKTREEIALLERAAKSADLGVVGALNHMEGALYFGGYATSEFSERIRVHCYEGGATGAGHAATMIGANGKIYFAPQGPEKLEEGNLMRMDATCHVEGYWANNGRMAVIGEPTGEQLAAYRQNLALKAVARDQLRPGVRCEQVYQAVKDAATHDGIRFWAEVGVGHGVGVAEREAPYLQPGDGTVLESGMVVVLDVNTFGPEGEIIHNKDTYEVTPDGARLMSWFRNWDRLYHLFGYRSQH